MRIDEARNDDGVGRVDDLCLGWGFHLIADADDLLAVDEHVTADEVADFRVHAYDGAAFEEDGLPRWSGVFDDLRALSGSRVTQEERRRCDGGCSPERNRGATCLRM